MTTVCGKSQQLNVTQETVGSFSEMKEKAASVFVHIIVKLRYRIGVQERVKEPTASFQLASVTGYAEIPRLYIHALGWRLANEDAWTIWMAYSSSIGMCG